MSATMRRRAVTESRIAHIAQMMRRLEWRTGESGPALATQWGLSTSSLEKLAAEASKQVRAELGDPDEVRRLTTAALTKVLHDAIASGDPRTVIRAAETLARIVGAVAPARHDIRGGVGGQIRIIPASVQIPEEIPDDHPSVVAASRAAAATPRGGFRMVGNVAIPDEVPDADSFLGVPPLKHANGRPRA